jgi:hypothetical protein
LRKSYALPATLARRGFSALTLGSDEEDVMELSAADLKMIGWLKRQHAAWRSTRVITAIGAVVMLVWAGLAWLRGEPSSGIIALVGMAGFCLSYSLGSWSGRPEISLLLKLIEDRRGGGAE